MENNTPCLDLSYKPHALQREITQETLMRNAIGFISRFSKRGSLKKVKNIAPIT